jgi:hypothetical protein
MRLPRSLISFVAIAGLGCASRGDWISETLTLMDVSGTWGGTVGSVARIRGQGPLRSIRLVLKQRRARVVGDMEAWGGQHSVEGLVNGDVFSFQPRPFGVKPPSMDRRCGANRWHGLPLRLRRVGEADDQR